jgi:hypothetical protein
MGPLEEEEEEEEEELCFVVRLVFLVGWWKGFVFPVLWHEVRALFPDLYHVPDQCMSGLLVS